MLNIENFLKFMMEAEKIIILHLSEKTAPRFSKCDSFWSFPGNIQKAETCTL